MNKTLSLILPLCVAMISCAPQPQTMASIDNCPSEPHANRCPAEESKRNKINIIIIPDDIVVAPSMVCASRGTRIEVTLRKTGNVADGVFVATVPKNGDDGWILEAGTLPGTMYIDVPEEIAVDKYGYSILTSTGKCKDPMIHVDQ